MSTNGKEGDNKGDVESSQTTVERKRKREKQRRSDITDAFNSLAALMAEVEPENDDIQSFNLKGRQKKKPDVDDVAGTSRLDLIRSAIAIMKRLHFENEERKSIIAALRQNMTKSHLNDNVLMVVPTLTPADEGHAISRAEYAPGLHHLPHMYPSQQEALSNQHPISARMLNSGYHQLSPWGQALVDMSHRAPRPVPMSHSLGMAGSYPIGLRHEASPDLLADLSRESKYRGKKCPPSG